MVLPRGPVQLRKRQRTLSLAAPSITANTVGHTRVRITSPLPAKPPGPILRGRFWKNTKPLLSGQQIQESGARLLPPNVLCPFPAAAFPRRPVAHTTLYSPTTSSKQPSA